MGRYVNLEGFEPPTAASVVQCSIQLSYRSWLICLTKVRNKSHGGVFALTLIQKVLDLAQCKRYLLNEMKKLFFVFLLGSLTTPNVWAQADQDSKQPTTEPIPLTEKAEQDVHKTDTDRLEILPIEWPDYGSLLVDEGFSLLRDCPKEMRDKAFNARSLNLSVYYNFRLKKSHFNISTGVGLGFEGFEFEFEKKNKQHYTLKRNESSRKTEFNTLKSSTKKEYLQSSLTVSYVDLFILEFRINANKKYPKEGFWGALGGKLGMRWGAASTTVKYQQDKETKKSVAEESFNLNKMRGRAHVRVGWGRFSVFYTHTFSNLFSGEGPGTTTKPSTLGLSVDFF